jgi:hypothetical protein
MSGTPTIYDIGTDSHAARFGLQPWERDTLLRRCFARRHDGRIQGAAAYIVCHIQEGSTVGSLEHFVHGHYADGSKVQASCTVTIQHDGSILRVIPERDGPWTNGAVRKPTARGRAVIARGGNPNIWTLSVEMEGRHNVAISEAQMRSAEWWIRDAARRHGIPIDRDHILRHADVDQVQRAHCPGRYFEPLMRRLEAPPEAPPDALPEDEAPGSTPSTAYGRIVLFDTPRLVTITVDGGLNVRQWGDLDAPILETWPLDRRFYASGYVFGDAVDGERRWYIAAGPRAWRLWSGGTDRTGLDIPA